MGSGDPTLPTICLECGAENQPGAQACWVCRGPLWHRPAAALTGKHPPPPPPLKPTAVEAAAGRVIRPSVIAAWIAALALSAGLSYERPALAILVAVLFGPALLLTSVSVARHRAEGQPMSRTELVLRIFGMAFLVAAVLFALFVVFVVAVIVALYIMCTGSLGR